MIFEDPFEGEEHVKEQAGQLLKYARKELSPNDETVILEHLHECAACRLGLVELRRDFDLPATTIEQAAYWEWVRERIRLFLAARFPTLKPRQFDLLWDILAESNVLGQFRPGIIPIPTEIGFVGPSGATPLPVLIGVLSNVAAAEHRTSVSGEAEQTLQRLAHFSPAGASAFVRDFDLFLQDDL